jgi:lipopolysaccharide export LptBFGC system permease protein LptF
MSWTLFKYLFKDLFRIFMMASGTLAGIMSFGGLLRPLTEHGLDAGQVGKMLTYLTPAMMTYSLPVAALFATTMVYGRLSADNELTAVRAGGIPSFALFHFSIAAPALMLGLIVAALSMLLLCFIVPVASLKVEQVIYSNLAKVVQNKIERNHQLRLSAGGKPTTIFAQEATLLPPDPDAPHDQLVRLVGPSLMSGRYVDRDSAFLPATDPVSGLPTTRPKATDRSKALLLPEEFWTAQSATVRIHPAGNGAPGIPGSDEGQLSVQLTGATKFPRKFVGNVQVGVDATNFGPVALPSPIRENVKFMDVRRLSALAIDPGDSQRVQSAVQDLIRQDQESTFLREIGDKLADSGTVVLRSGAGTEADEKYILRFAGSRQFIGMKEGELAVGTPAPPASAATRPDESTQTRMVGLEIMQAGGTSLTATAREARIRAKPDDTTDRMVVSVELYDLVLTTAGAGQETQRASWVRDFDVPMEGAVQDLRHKTLTMYLHDPKLNVNDQNNLLRQQIVVNNAVRGELHSRASFAVSCLILVTIGCALGMMFKSGNFLSAFAVSFVPALLCITLIVSGQQTADHVPEHVLNNPNNPLNLGLSLIWSGNAIVLLMAMTLIYKLRRA